MDFIENFKQSIESLKSNKLRSFLTMLGISIGIAAVVIIVAIGNGGQALITGEFDKLGANIIELRVKAKNVTDKDLLTLDDVDILTGAIPQIKNISPFTYKVDGKIRIGSNVSDAMITGCNFQLKTIRGIEIVDGRFFTEYDEKVKNNVAVIADTSAKKFFNSTNVTGKTLTYRNSMGSTQLTIVGVYKDLNPFADMMGDEMPCIILMPVTTVASMYNNKYVDSIIATVEDKDIVEDIGIRMANIMEYVHKNKDKYYAQNTASMMESINKALRIVTIIIGAAAGISLLVGGIGIMNIMLVSVKERTREIGIRKALGARNRDIVLQFLTEAVIMTGLSGLVGILMGVLIAFIASKIVQIELPVTLWVGVVAFVFSALFGVFFGVYPAKKAAELDPIEALRYE